MRKPTEDEVKAAFKDCFEQGYIDLISHNVIEGKTPLAEIMWMCYARGVLEFKGIKQEL